MDTAPFERDNTPPTKKVGLLEAMAEEFLAKKGNSIYDHSLVRVFTVAVMWIAVLCIAIFSLFLVIAAISLLGNLFRLW